MNAEINDVRAELLALMAVKPAGAQFGHLDPSELSRVYQVTPETPATDDATGDVVRHATPAGNPGATPASPSLDAETAATLARLAAAEAEATGLRALLAEVRAGRDELRQDRDHWRQQAERAMPALTGPKPERRPWWRLYRAWKSGRMSATRTDAGQIEVEAAELFRVFAPIAVQGASMHHGATADATAESALRVNALEVEVKMLREMLDAMREDRNSWRDQAARIVAALPAPAIERRPWWRRLAAG